MSEVLKPCPFCGSTDLHIEHMEGTVLHPAYAVICGYCSAQSNYVDRGAHVEVWNQRAIPEGSVLVPRELAQRFFDAVPEEEDWDALESILTQQVKP